MKCTRCRKQAVVSLPSHHSGFCAYCYNLFFHRQAGKAIKKHRMLTGGDTPLVALSGGKDSMALVHQLQVLGYHPHALHIDLDIPEYSPTAREYVQNFCERQKVFVYILTAKEQGLSIPTVRGQLKGPICSSCGKIKRYLFNKFAVDNGYKLLATGHNLDDEAARLMANTLRWDTDYLCDVGPVLEATSGFVRRIKPLYRLTEFETANYCFLNGIEYNMYPCPYSQGASFNIYKALLHDLEKKQPGRKLDFYEGFLKKARPLLNANTGVKDIQLNNCRICGYPTSGEICSVCRIKNSLQPTCK